VKRQEYDLPPQWFATGWDFTVTAGGKTLKPVTARPGMNSAPTSASGLDLEPVWVGLGTVSDFAGRDVRGKAVVIHSWPSPGVINNSAFTYGSIQRAVEKGASAVIVNLAIPGNVDAMTFARIPTAAGRANSNVPVFSLGSNDTTQLRELMEAGPVKIHLQLTTETKSGLKEHGVWGILPGATDEDIIVQAHHDSVFYGSLDNASGMAVMIGMAEYFSKIPKAQRRRTIRFESSVHHPGNVASIWLHENRATELAKTALSINCEHVAAVQTNWNRYEGGQLLRTTNNVARRWWVGGSPKLADIVLNAFQMFGLGINETMDTSAPGTMSNHSLDVPSMQIIESAIYYHTDHDTPDFIPAAALESVARAFSKVIDDVNKVDRKDLLAAAPATSSSRPQQ
jgi:hypothetical protein